MPTDETTLADRVREAREALLRDVEELARLAAVKVARETKGRVVPKTVRCKVTGDFPALDAYAAAIRTERDTAWQAAIEGMRRNMNDEIIAAIDDPRHSRDERSGLRMARIIADRHCAALSALADRMGVTNE